MPLIQQELDRTVERWNNHLISHSRNAGCPHGRPNVLYTVPEETGKDISRMVDNIGCTYTIYSVKLHASIYDNSISTFAQGLSDEMEVKVVI